MERAVAFVLENVPSPRALAVGGPLGLAWAYACLLLAGWLKRARGWRTGATRKVFHFLIFGSVAAIEALWDTSSVCLFGGMVSLVLLHAILRGEGHLLYEAVARERDAPHRTHYVVVAYLATLIGGVAANVWFGPLALVGYLVTGLGDAVAEPVGLRFGRHLYRVPALGVRAVRSLEGSAAVFGASLLSIALAAGLSPALELSAAALGWVPAVALAATLVEAVTPHGWDNATLQLVPPFLVRLWAQ